MSDERLSPGVKNAQDADLRAQMTRVGGDLAQRGRTRVKEPGVQLRRVAIAERQQRVRQRENDVHVRHVEELALPGREPAGASTCRIGRRVGPSPPSAVRPAGNTGCGEPKIPALETRISLSDKPVDRDRRRYEPVRADSIKAMSHGLHERAGYITATVFAIAHEVTLATEGQTIHLSTSN